MTAPIIDVNYEGDVDLAGIDIETISTSAVTAAIALTDLEIVEGGELSLLICDDENIQRLNSQWRGKNKPTNVLSFPVEDDSLLLGDIVVSMDTVKREAALESKSIKDHLTHLIIHGFLHLFGYDHETEDEAAEMESLETEILGKLGIANPYENAQML